MHVLNQTELVNKQQNTCSDSSDDDDNNNQLKKNLDLFDILLSKDEEEHKKVRLREALKNGANINFQDANRDSDTLLHRAVRKKYLKLISYLLKEPSIRVDLKNKNNKTPSDLAVGNEKILALLNTFPPQVSDLVSLNQGEQSFLVSLSHEPSVNQEDPLSSQPGLSQQSGKVKRPLENIERESNVDNKNRKIACLPDGPYPASGLKSSLHGVVYQVKLLMLFAWKGKEKGYSFRLATEMNAAEKFDDVVLQYMKTRTDDVSSRFLQAKHIQVDKENIEKITGQDLLTESDDKFSLQKYFISYLKIKRNPDFSGLQDFIICTNVNFNFDIEFNQQNLKKLSQPCQPLYFETVSEEDDILNLGGERYRFVSKDTDEDKREEVVSELNKLFNRTSESKKLAEALAHHLLKGESINLNNYFFKSYHVPLVRYVIDRRSQWLSKGFIYGNQNRPEVESLREAFREAVEQHLKNLKQLEEKDPEKVNKRDRGILKKILDSEPPSKKLKAEIGDGALDSFWSKMKSLWLQVSDGFKKTLVLDENPNLISPEMYSKEMSILININNNNKKITIQEQKKENGILIAEIYKLAGHVLVKNEVVGNNKEVVIFGDNFLSGKLLKGNLGDFRIKLMTKLGVDNFDDLKTTLTDYEFKITKFQTCRESEFDALLQYQSTITFPDSQISREQVEEFVDKLVFAVDQPNEEKLGELISHEIGGEFNLINSDLIADSFQKKMLDWLKEKQGTFKTENDIDFFVDNTKKEILQWVMIGPTSEYVTKLEQSGVTFKESSLPKKLNKYLNRQDGMKRAPLHFQVEQEQTQLSSIQVNQVIKRMGKYDKQGSYIFVNLKTLLRLHEKVVQALSGTESELLIVECNLRTEPMNNLYSDLSTLSSSKQLLFIASVDHPLVVKFPERSIVKNEKCHWQDLTPASQENILKRTANFQGYTVELQQLMDINSPAAGALPLASLLASERPIEVGRPVPTSDGYDANFYVDRTLNRSRIAIKATLFDDLKNPQFNDLVASSQQDFERLCGKDQSTNVHWLQEEEPGQWLWRKSRGSLTNLRKYIRFGQTRRRTHEVQAFLQDVEKHRVMLVADTAGMGKTTVVTHLSKSIKKDKPDFWVVRIDLNRHTDALKDRPGGFTMDSAIEFISEKLLKLDNPLERELLDQSLRLGRGPPLVLMFDGFDEISPSYKETVINLLTILKSTAIKQLWVTTRPHLKETLEDKLQQLAYTLEPFSETDQIDFLIRFWKNNIKLSENGAPNVDRLQDYAHQLVRKLASSIKERDGKFTGVPLQTKMLAESFQAKIKEHLQKEIGTLELSDKLELIDLYEAFIKEKHRIYQSEKLNKDLNNPGVQEEQHSIFEDFKKTHQKLAMKSILGEEKYRDMLTGESDANVPEEKICRAGLVQFADGRPHFVHRTFAEYFMADFIAETLRREQPPSETFQDLFFKEILLEDEHQVIRGFINGFLERAFPQRGLFKQCGNKIRTLFLSNKNDLCNSSHHTMLYQSVDDGNDAIVQFVLECIKEIKNNEEVFSYLSNGPKENEPVLHRAIFHNNSKIVNILVKNGADVEKTASYGDTALHRAVELGCKDLVDFLIKSKDEGGGGSDVNAKNDFGGTPLYVSVAKDNLDIIESLMEKSDVNHQDNYGVSVLHNSIHSARSREIAEKLVGKEVKVNVKDNDGISVLHYAAYNGKLDVVQYLEENGWDINLKSNDDSTILHEATLSGNINLCQWIVEKNPSLINSKDANGRTPLHEAAERDRLNIVEFFESKGAKMESTDEHGNNLLLEAAKYSSRTTCEWFISKGCDIQHVNKKGETILHISIKYGNFEVVKWLVSDKGFSPNIKDKSSNPAIVEVCKHVPEVETEELIKRSYLSEDNIHCRKYWYPQETDVEMIRYFIERGVDFNDKDENGRTILHYAAEYGQDEVVKELVTAKDQGKIAPDVALKDKEQLTGLILAAHSDHWDIVVMLLHHGADIDDLSAEECSLLKDYLEKENIKIEQELLVKIDVRLAESQAESIRAVADQSGQVLEPKV